MDYWYYRTKSVDYSLKLERLISATLSLLTGYPEAGKLFNEKRNIRFVIVKYYRIYYTCSDEELTVLHIRDTRRDETKLDV